MNRIIKKIENFNPYTPVFGIIRSFLILATLLVLLFNDTSTLFSYHQFNLSCDYFYIPGAFCFLTPTNFNMELIRYMMILVLLVAISGYLPRVTGVFHWYICYSIQISAITIDGGEQIATVISFLLIPLTLFDKRKNHFQSSDRVKYSFISKTIIFLCYQLIKIQVCIIYLNAAIGRLKNSEWADGTAIYYFFTDPIFGINEFQYVLLSPILESNLLIYVTWSVTILELYLASNIIGTAVSKKYALILGVLLHIGILFTIGIWTFSIVMIASLMFYLLPLDISKERMITFITRRREKHDTIAN